MPYAVNLIISSTVRRIVVGRLVFYLFVALVYPCVNYFPIQPYLLPRHWPSPEALWWALAGSRTIENSSSLLPMPLPSLTNTRGYWMIYPYNNHLHFEFLELSKRIAPLFSFLACGFTLPVTMLAVFTLLVGKQLRSYEREEEIPIRLATNRSVNQPQKWYELTEKILDSDFETVGIDGRFASETTM